MAGKDRLYFGLSGLRQFPIQAAAVGGASRPLHKSLLFQLVYHIRHTAACEQHLFCDGPQRRRAFVVEQFQYRELTDAQVVAGDVLPCLFTDTTATPRQNDEQMQGALRLFIVGCFICFVHVNFRLI